MTTLRTAAQRALEALEDARTFTGAWPTGSKAVAALRAALAQQAEPRNQCGETCERARLCATCAQALAQQAEPVEPMAWVLDGTSVVEFYREPYHNGPEWTPLCKCADTPPQRKPLTEEEIYRIHKDLCNTVGGSYKTMARAVEAAHGIKE